MASYTPNYNHEKIPWVNDIIDFAIDMESEITELDGNNKKVILDYDGKNFKHVKNGGKLIVKSGFADEKFYKGMNANEHFFSYIAKEAGLKTAENAILHDGFGDYILISERFDEGKRQYSVGDFLGLESQFDFIVKDFAEKLDKLKIDKLVKMDFAKQLYFNILIGNLDTHANNFSLLIDEKTNKLEMSPIFDVCHTDGLLRSFNVINTKNVAEVNSKNKNITIQDILKDMNLNDEDQLQLIKDFEHITTSVAGKIGEISKSMIDPTLAKEYKQIVNENLYFAAKELKALKESSPAKKWEKVHKVFPVLKNATEEQKIDFIAKELSKHNEPIAEDFILSEEETQKAENEVVPKDFITSPEEKVEMLKAENEMLKKKLSMANEMIKSYNIPEDFMEDIKASVPKA